jgi:hypothetical protein
VLPHTRRRWAFCAWAFGGGLAAALCSAIVFSFFLFLSKSSFIFYQNLVGFTPSVFLQFFDKFCLKIAQNY